MKSSSTIVSYLFGVLLVGWEKAWDDLLDMHVLLGVFVYLKENN